MWTSAPERLDRAELLPALERLTRNMRTTGAIPACHQARRITFARRSALAVALPQHRGHGGADMGDIVDRAQMFLQPAHLFDIAPDFFLRIERRKEFRRVA